MDAEFETLAVDVSGEWLKAMAVGGGREAVFSGNEAAVCVHVELSVWAITMRFGVWLGPLNVDDDVLPTMAFEMGGHVICVLFYFAFCYASAERVPTVPAHGRRGGEHWVFGVRGEGDCYECRCCCTEKLGFATH
jgi:hypothetical protein